MTVVLDVRDLYIAFGGLQALFKINFTVQKGDILGLIGPNGAGKTALLNCINGIYMPNKGEILFKGQSIVGLPCHRIFSLGIGRTFQHAELFKGLSVIENALLGRHIYTSTSIFSGGLFWGPGRKEEAKAREKAEEVLEFLELSSYRKATVADLPFGVQKVVGLARALAGEPDILLIDEISSGLVRQEKEELARSLLRIHHELGTTIVWIEHDMQMVTDICNRLVCLDFGVKIKEGTPKEVISDPKVIEAYLGIPQALAGEGVT